MLVASKENPATLSSSEVNPEGLSYPDMLELSSCQVPRAWLREAEVAVPTGT